MQYKMYGNAMSNDSRHSLMIKLGEYFDDGILQFVHGQKLTTIDIQRVIERDEFPDHLLGNIHVGYMKRVCRIRIKSK